VAALGEAAALRDATLTALDDLAARAAAAAGDRARRLAEQIRERAAGR
jgi:hypothetical protein